MNPAADYEHHTDPDALLEAVERKRREHPADALALAALKKAAKAPGKYGLNLRDLDAAAPRAGRFVDPNAGRALDKSAGRGGDKNADQNPDAAGKKSGAKKPPSGAAPARKRGAANDNDADKPSLGAAADDRGPASASNHVHTGLWSVAAAAATAALLVLTVSALTVTPEPLTVTRLSVQWLPGPQIPDRAFQRWVARFPGQDKLAKPDDWVLSKFADYLAALPAVAEVRQVRLVHEPALTTDGKRVQRRTLELTLGLRTPVMPAMLKSGERAWVDADGRLLPGELPGPQAGSNRRPPLLRSAEDVDAATTRSAVRLWQALAPLLEPGLLADIALADPIDDHGATGIVLYTQQGSRLVWGRPDEERYGVSFDDKVRGLVHTLKSNGDLARVAEVNVRFRQPFFTLRK